MIVVIEVALQIKAPEVRKELDLLSEDAVMIKVAEVVLTTDGVVLKTRIYKNLAESWLKNPEMMKIEKVSHDLINCISKKFFVRQRPQD